MRAGYDIDEDCRLAYEANNAPARFFAKDIRKVTGPQILAHYPKGALKALVGCAPCTPFSLLRKGKDTSGEAEWSLLGEFERLVRSVKPELVSMENVPQVRGHEVFSDFVEALGSLGYSMHVSVVKCEDYGIPQKRRRLVLLGSKLGPIRLVAPTHDKPSTVRRTIDGLPRISAGERARRDRLHWSAKLTERNLRRVRASKPGGTWADWPEEDRLECHKTDAGASYVEVYGRMEWTKPSPPITTKFFNLGSGRFGHPDQDRALSAREGALLQTFPRGYRFDTAREPLQLTKLGMLIGNAVPPRLGEAVGASLRHHVLLNAPERLAKPRAPRGWGRALRREMSLERKAAASPVGKP